MNLRRRWRRPTWPPPGGQAATPIVPDGWQVGPPDFVGVGAQKAGTSWWYDLLITHPRVSHPPGAPKERHFFADFWGVPFTTTDAERYARSFPRSPGSQAGEWTPRYMHDVWVPPLLARAAPLARILVLLRDPVDRFLSGLAHDQARGAPSHPAVATDAFERGLYGVQLDRLFKHIDPARVLVLQFERCRSDVNGQLRRTHEFLELDHRPATSGDTVINPARVPKAVLPPEARSAMVEAYRADAARLTELVPELDLDLWPSLLD